MKHRLVDVNVYLSRWPCRRLPYDEPQRLVEKLQASGVSEAWAGSFDALLHKDLRAVNAKLVATCKKYGHGFLKPIGAVNPQLPGWREDLEECHSNYQMQAIRLHPNYHGYTLSDPSFRELIQLANQRNLSLQIAVRMEDTRTQHHLMKAVDVDVMPLMELLPQYPKQPVVLLNALKSLTVEKSEQLASIGQVFFEIAMLEGVGGISEWLNRLPQERLLFGSYTPFFNVESALLKLRESPLGGIQREAIRFRNAEERMPN
jgi:hypothetical protein